MEHNKVQYLHSATLDRARVNSGTATSKSATQIAKHQNSASLIVKYKIVQHYLLQH